MARTVVGSLLAAMLIVVTDAPKASAAVDMNGGWNIIITNQFFGGDLQCQIAVTQVGTALGVNGISCPLVGSFTLSGTIDTGTGDFSLSGPPAGICSAGITVGGTTNGTSTAFTGIYDCASTGGGIGLQGVLDGSRCGNGVLDAGEICDDGARVDGDCCSRTCTYEAAGFPCPHDTNDCTYDQCDGAGTCAHVTATGVKCTNDGNPCTDDICSASAVCEHLPNTEPCSDGDACTVGDACGGGTCAAGACSPCCDESGGCVPALGIGCKTSVTPTGPLQLRADPYPTANLVKWKWAHGDALTLAELGDPTTSTGYALCLYRHDGAGDLGLVYQSIVPAGGTCGTRPCWAASPGKGYKYKDRVGTHGGVTQIVLRSGLAGKSKATIKGKGPNVSANVVAGPLPVFAQLRATNGTCVEAGYADATEDTWGFAGSLPFVHFRAKKSSPSGAFLD